MRFLRAGLQMSFTVALNCIMCFWNALLMRAWFLRLPWKHHKVFPVNTWLSISWSFTPAEKKRKERDALLSSLLSFLRCLWSCTPAPSPREEPQAVNLVFRCGHTVKLQRYTYSLLNLHCERIGWKAVDTVCAAVLNNVRIWSICSS